MGNSKSSMAIEEAVLSAAIQEMTESKLRQSCRRGLEDDCESVQEAMIAAMNGDHSEEVLQKITKYQEQRKRIRSFRSKPKRTSSYDSGIEEPKPPVESISFPTNAAVEEKL